MFHTVVLNICYNSKYKNVPSANQLKKFFDRLIYLYIIGIQRIYLNDFFLVYQKAAAAAIPSKILHVFVLKLNQKEKNNTYHTVY